MAADEPYVYRTNRPFRGIAFLLGFVAFLTGAIFYVSFVSGEPSNFLLAATIAILPAALYQGGIEECVTIDRSIRYTRTFRAWGQLLSTHTFTAPAGTPPATRIDTTIIKTTTYYHAKIAFPPHMEFMPAGGWFDTEQAAQMHLDALLAYLDESISA